MTDPGDGRLVSVCTSETREQAEAAAANSAEWVSENVADSIALRKNLTKSEPDYARANPLQIWGPGTVELAKGEVHITGYAVWRLSSRAERHRCLSGLSEADFTRAIEGEKLRWLAG